MGDPTLVPFTLQLYVITSPFSPSHRRERRCWSSTQAPAIPVFPKSLGRLLTTFPYWQKYYRPLCQRQWDTPEEQAGNGEFAPAAERSWKETPGKEEAALWWGEVRLRKRAADKCPVKPTSSILLSGDFICLLWPHPDHVNHCALLTEWIILQLSVNYWLTLCSGCFWFDIRRELQQKSLKGVDITNHHMTGWLMVLFWPFPVSSNQEIEMQLLSAALLGHTFPRAALMPEEKDIWCGLHHWEDKNRWATHRKDAPGRRSP